MSSGEAAGGPGANRRFTPSFDIPAGIAVALVLIPQCLAYAELAGMPPHRGLLVAAIPPIAAAFFASSPYLQTGPVALTSLLTLAALSGRADLASEDYVLLGVLLAGIVGVVRVGISLVRGGRLAHVLSQPVLRGFVLGAALLILGSQLPSALGVGTADRGLVGEALWTLSHPASWDPEASLLSLVTIVLILGGRRVHARFPGVLVALVGGLLYSVLGDYSGAKVGAIEPGAWGLSGSLPWDQLPQLLIPGVVIALVAFGEAVSISQTFADQDGEEWDANREFLSQGVANLASAGVGGFPVGGSFSRSSLSRLSGARSRWSGAITGATVLLFLPFGAVLEHLPKALLGATVISAVASLLDPRPVFQLFKTGSLRGLIGAATFLFTVLSAPRVEVAVVAGAALANVLDLTRDLRMRVSSEERDGRVVLVPRGHLCFLSAGRLDRALTEALGGLEGKSACLDLSQLSGLDGTGRGLLSAVQQGLARRGLDLVRLSPADGPTPLAAAPENGGLNP